MGLGKFQWRKCVPVDQVRTTAGLPSAPSIQHTVGRRVAVEVDAPADMPHDKPSSNGLPRGWGGLGKIQGGRCVSVEQFQMLGGAPVHRLALRDSIDCRGQLRYR